ncbi:hypothetical protein SNEBB_001071 [Seison nebaliae]|nr:hypothetical protein SNEBB_001071 [Seison nebaliae]
MSIIIQLILFIKKTYITSIYMLILITFHDRFGLISGEIFTPLDNGTLPLVIKKQLYFVAEIHRPEETEMLRSLTDPLKSHDYKLGACHHYMIFKNFSDQNDLEWTTESISFSDVTGNLHRITCQTELIIAAYPKTKQELTVCRSIPKVFEGVDNKIEISKLIQIIIVDPNYSSFKGMLTLAGIILAFIIAIIVGIFLYFRRKIKTVGRSTVEPVTRTSYQQFDPTSKTEDLK